MTQQKTGDKRTFVLNLIDAGISKDTDFIFVAGVGWVANRNVCTGKSYNYLEECGYVIGKKITLDGTDYLCRILRCTEWDDCMDWNDSDDVWHWKDVYSWVRSLEYERAASIYRVIRGYPASSYLGNGNAPAATANVGFRPALEVLNSDTPGSDDKQTDPTLSSAIDRAVTEEVKRANATHGATFHSPHEAYAVIAEELDEAAENANTCGDALTTLWACVKRDLDYTAQLDAIEKHALDAAAEFVQVAAMARKARG
jgi:hypothetical protein